MTNNGERELRQRLLAAPGRPGKCVRLPLVRRGPVVPLDVPVCACRASLTPVRTRWYVHGTLKPGFHCAILAQAIVVMRLPAQETQGARAEGATLFGWISFLGTEGLSPLTHPILVV